MSKFDTAMAGNRFLSCRNQLVSDYSGENKDRRAAPAIFTNLGGKQVKEGNRQ